LDYLTGSSDLDLLLQINRHTDLRQLTAGLTEIERTAPMRLDGELIRDDGVAVNWREFHTRPREVLIKGPGGTQLLDTSLFPPGKASS